jgi:hypothetical protein
MKRLALVLAAAALVSLVAEEALAQRAVVRSGPRRTAVRVNAPFGTQVAVNSGFRGRRNAVVVNSFGFPVAAHSFVVPQFVPVPVGVQSFGYQSFGAFGGFGGFGGCGY